MAPLIALTSIQETGKMLDRIPSTGRTVAFFGLQWNGDWCRRFAEFLPAWPAEAALLRMLHRDVFL